MGRLVQNLCKVPGLLGVLLLEGDLMNDSQMTRSSLLVRLREAQDGEAWTQFVEIYSPFLYQYLRRRGLQDADAADVAQEVLRTVVRSVGGFEHGRRAGSFRAWLISIARSRLSDFAAQQKHQVSGSGDTTAMETLNQQPAPDDEELLEQEYQECLFQWATDKVRGEFQESTWQAFWQTYVEGRSCKEVARHLQMTVKAVYVARSRALSRLKSKVRQVEG
jgi:RNA polymerase sigma factor (sigma-70 family)